MKKNNNESFRGGDSVVVDGRRAAVKAAKRKADKAGGSRRGQRTFCVEFEDGSTKHVSASRVVPCPKSRGK